MPTPPRRLPYAALLSCHVALSLLASLATLAGLVAIDSGIPALPAIMPACMGGALLLASFLILLAQGEADYAKLFVAAAIPASCAFALLILPDQIPDEIWHIFRVLNFAGSGRDMIAPGSLVFGSMPTTYEGLGSSLALDGWQGSYTVERDMSSYLSHLYAVPGVSVALARAIGATPFVTVYVARLTNAALFVCCGHWILNTMPLCRTTTLLYLLNPMLVQQQASCSADAISNLSALAFMALLLRCVFAAEVGRRSLAGLAFVSVIMALSKYAYAPLLLLLMLLLPKVPDARTRRVIVGATSLLLAAAVAYMVLLYQGTLRPGIELILSPGECVRVLANTLHEMGPFWIRSFAGGNLGNLNINPWEPLVWLYLVVLVLSVFHNDESPAPSLSNRQRAIILLVVGLTATLVVVALRDWSINAEHNADIIVGVQGRYFIPLLLYPLLCLTPRDRVATTTHPQLTYVLIMTVIYVGDVLAIVRLFA